jgi:ATP:ADP antiporter, AAA family
MTHQDGRGVRRERSALDWVLSLFTEVRPGEGVQVVALLVAVFTLLFAYYVIKTVREPLILAMGGADVKSYGSAALAVTMLVFVPLYSWFAGRVSRVKLLVGSGVFFGVGLELFCLAAWAKVPGLGFLFYVWVGLLSVSSVAQFWSFAADLYTKEAGARLFAVIGVGASLGGAFGSSLAKRLFKGGFDAYTMLHIAAALLAAHVALMVWVHFRHVREVGFDGLAAGRQALESAWDAAKAGFSMIFQRRYLMLIAGVLLLLNWVNTNGEWLLGHAIDGAALASLRDASPGLADEALRALPAYKAKVGEFWGGFYETVNYLALGIQALLVSRLVKYGGLALVVLLLPIISLGVYGGLLVGVGLGTLRMLKAAENATDYSVMNTAKAMLWLPTSPAEKYRAKQAADTFFVRLGDVMSFVVITQLGVKGGALALLNVGLVVAWIGASVWLLREAKALPDPQPDPLPEPLSEAAPAKGAQ